MIWNRLWSVRNQSYECGRFFFITLAKKLKNLSWKDGWFRRWYVFAFKHTQTKLSTFYEYLLPFLILTINTSKQFKVASILLSQFKCITILRFYLKIFIQVRFVVVFLIFVHKATSVFCPMDQKNMREPITWLCLIPIITIIIGSFIIQRVRWNSFIYTITKQTWNKCL